MLAAWPFFPDVVFWSLEEGEPPSTLAVDRREFMRIGPPGMVVVFARISSWKIALE